MEIVNWVFFYLSNHVHLLDLAGPVQVFYESGEYGIPYEVSFVSDEESKQFSAGPLADKLIHFSTVSLNKNDILIIPGFSVKSNTQLNKDFANWLRAAHEQQVTICTICTGIFTLAKAGLLDNTECTTHWKYTDELQKQFPNLKVQKNRLFIKSKNIYTSAGITTGIDLALSLIEERHGAKFAYQLAKELVTYIRRDSADTQESIFIQYRQHINYQVHEVQDWIIHHLQRKISITDLADKVNMSPRNLTRLFKAKTGITIGDYIEKLKVEKALQLLKQKVKMISIAHQCGFKSAGALLQLLKKHAALVPKELKKMS